MKTKKMFNRLFGLLLTVGLVLTCVQPVQANSVTSAKAKQVPAISKVTEYYTDSEGRKVWSSEYTATYNQKGYLKKVVLNFSKDDYNPQLRHIYRYYYSSQGRLVKCTDGTESDKKPSTVTKFTYDSKGRLKTKKETRKGVVYKLSYKRNQRGQITEITGIEGDRQKYKAKYTYKDGRVSRIDLKDYSRGTSIATVKYTRVNGKKKVKNINTEQLTKTYYDRIGDIDKWTYDYYSNGKIKKLTHISYNKKTPKDKDKTTATYNRKGVVKKITEKTYHNTVTTFSNGLPVKTTGDEKATWKYSKKNGRVVGTVYNNQKMIEVEYTKKKAVSIPKEVLEHVETLDKNGGFNMLLTIYDPNIYNPFENLMN